ncbi:hypothetical protein ACFWCF_01895 [Rhodococcus sp. NPDC060090]|uniref:hypothetical protein n=1 Tax=Rhodococcus sp. NPDC060090 TaxID=3347056 RepID=UPI00364F974D
MSAGKRDQLSIFSGDLTVIATDDAVEACPGREFFRGFFPEFSEVLQIVGVVDAP